MPSWGPDLVNKLILFYSILFYSILFYTGFLIKLFRVEMRQVYYNNSFLTFFQIALRIFFKFVLGLTIVL